MQPRRGLLLSAVLLLQSAVGCHGFSSRSSVSFATTSLRHGSRHSTSSSSTRRSVYFDRKTQSMSDAGFSSDSDSDSSDNSSLKQDATMMVDTQGMPDLERDLEMAAGMAQAEVSLEKFLLPLGMALVALGGSAACHYAGIDVGSTLSAFREDPQAFLQTYLDGLGPLAVVYFGGLYVAAELLAIPATPLTLSAGYLFGFTEGSLVVLAAGTLSACIGFFIGKTLLRQWVESVLEQNPQMKKLDNAIGSEGFKLLVLVRLSPIFPFSLLNYTYGASSIRFSTFVTGTLLGFTPSTLGYVYTGLAGKELLLGEGTQPWYVYAGALTVLLGFLKLVTDVATDIVGAMDDEPESIL